MTPVPLRQDIRIEKTMKLCDITQFFTPTSGGVKRYLLSKAEYIRSSEDLQHVLVLPGPKDSKAVNGPLTTYTIRSPRIPGTQSYRMLLRTDKIRNILLAERPDLVEVGDPYQLGWAAARLARELNLPVVAFYHSDYPRALGRTVERFTTRWTARTAERWLKRYLIGLYSRMSATFVASERMLQILAECGLKPLHLVPIGIDVQAFSPQRSRARVRSELGIDEGRFLLLYVGRMSREKNVKLLLHLIELLSREAPGQYHLLLVGEGHLDHLMRRASERREDVTWCRYCSDPQRLAEFYSAADLFVHAGKVETYGLTVLESQACGTPVIALRGGGTDLLNQAGEDFLAPRPHSTAFAETIQAVRPRLGDELRHGIQRKVAATFEVRKNFERQFDIYHQVLQAHRAKLGLPAAQPSRSNRAPAMLDGAPKASTPQEKTAAQTRLSEPPRA